MADEKTLRQVNTLLDIAERLLLEGEAGQEDGTRRLHERLLDLRARMERGELVAHASLEDALATFDRILALREEARQRAALAGRHDA